MKNFTPTHSFRVKTQLKDMSVDKYSVVKTQDIRTHIHLSENHEQSQRCEIFAGILECQEL